MRSKHSPGSAIEPGLTTYLTITGFGAHGDSGDESFKEHHFRNKRCQKERKMLEKSSTSYLGAWGRRFESCHPDQKTPMPNGIGVFFSMKPKEVSPWILPFKAISRSLTTGFAA